MSRAFPFNDLVVWHHPFHTRFSHNPLQIYDLDAYPTNDGYVSEATDLNNNERHSSLVIWALVILQQEQAVLDIVTIVYQL
jgi:hypothetical protein